MQDPPASATNSTPGGGAHELGRAGLARFRSAPATSWLDALLEEEDPLKLSSPGPTPPGPLTQLLTSPGPGLAPAPSGRVSAAAPSYVEPSADPGFFGGPQQEATQQNVAFHRMNSSPAEFLAGAVDGYFSSGFGMPGSYDYAGASLDGSPSSSSGKRLRDAGRGEQGGLLDMDMEKLLEDTVPCRVRAKRGCATHPRSIAERVRRTKISDRIRKLQELVPNMDKQTNTADMLEEAVEYVKNLQRQIQELTEQKKRCKCVAKS